MGKAVRGLYDKPCTGLMRSQRQGASGQVTHQLALSLGTSWSRPHDCLHVTCHVQGVAR